MEAAHHDQSCARKDLRPRDVNGNAVLYEAWTSGTREAAAVEKDNLDGGQVDAIDPPLPPRGSLLSDSYDLTPAHPIPGALVAVHGRARLRTCARVQQSPCTCRRPHPLSLLATLSAHCHHQPLRLALKYPPPLPTRSAVPFSSPSPCSAAASFGTSRGKHWWRRRRFDTTSRASTHRARGSLPPSPLNGPRPWLTLFLAIVGQKPVLQSLRGI
jgi:hypothetical protein